MGASRGWLRSLRRWKLCTKLLLSRQYASASAANASVPPLKIRLREYQEECIQAVLSHLDKGHKRLGVSLATGSGKTVIFTQLIDRVQPRNEADQTLILAHRQELVEQAARHCTNAYPTKTVEIEMGSMHASGSADITVASIQSIVSGSRISKFNPDDFKLVLVDEAHHIVAPGYMRTLDYFGLSKAQLSSPALVGVSATLSRFDGLRLGAAIDQIVYHKDYIDMIGEKWLSDVIFTTVQTKAYISRVKKGANGDFQPSELSRVVNTEQVNDITVRSWMSKAEGRKSTLVFCVDLEHVAGLTNTFRKHGLDARFVTGDTPKSERSARLDAFRSGEFPVLVNCGVFTEGTDIPNIDCVLLARPTKSRNLLVQMIGRGMRLYPGKKDCHVIDMVASLEAGIVTVPTLFGLDPSEMVRGARLDDLKDLKDKPNKEGDTSVSQLARSLGPHITGDHRLDFTHYDSVHDLIEDTSGERHVRAMSPNAWVQVDSQKYILAAKGGVLTLESRVSPSGPEPQFAVVWKHSLPMTEASKSPWSRPRVVATASTLSDALHAADTFASRKFDRVFIATSTNWRKTPASEGQLTFLNRLRDVSEDDVEPLTKEDITKGQAGDMITKIKFGARGRFDALQVKTRKAEREMEKRRKATEMTERETVRVGPLEA